jgi:hypothetical protein
MNKYGEEMRSDGRPTVDIAQLEKQSAQFEAFIDTLTRQIRTFRAEA